MAMNKREKDYLESLLTIVSFRLTSDVKLDVPIPVLLSGALSKGYLFCAAKTDHPRVVEACSSSVNHGTDSQIKTSSQGARELYSTKLIALKALRREVEKHCMERLRKVDKMIEAEEINND